MVEDGKAKKKQDAGDAELAQALQVMRTRMSDPSVGVNEPHSVTRYLVLDAIRMFEQVNGRPARTIYVPRAVEACLQIALARECDIHGRLRVNFGTTLYGCRPVWDAEHFTLE